MPDNRTRYEPPLVSNHQRPAPQGSWRAPEGPKHGGITRGGKHEINRKPAASRTKWERTNG